MALTDADMAHLKRLARLELSDEETAELEVDLNRILEYFATLEALDLDGVEPLARPLPHGAALRGDELRPGLQRERALALGRAHDEGFFRVPRTVDES